MAPNSQWYSDPESNWAPGIFSAMCCPYTIWTLKFLPVGIEPDISVLKGPCPAVRRRKAYTSKIKTNVGTRLNLPTYQLKCKAEYTKEVTLRRQNVSTMQQIQSQGNDHEILILEQCDNKLFTARLSLRERAFHGILSQRRRSIHKQSRWC